MGLKIEHQAADLDVQGEFLAGVIARGEFQGLDLDGEWVAFQVVEELADRAVVAGYLYATVERAE